MIDFRHLFSTYYSHGFGRMAKWVVILSCYFALFNIFPNGMYRGVEAEAVTVFSWLPREVLESRWLFKATKILFLVTSVVWLAGRLSPVSSIVATVSYLLHLSLYYQNIPYWDHQIHMASCLLGILCIWEIFCFKEIRDREITHDFPKWIYVLILVYMSSYYMLAAISKLWIGGLRWADGVNLQMYIVAVGNPESPLSDPILSSRLVAAALQSASLLAEGLFALIFFSKYFRWGLGVFMAVFHVASMILFRRSEVSFHTNIALLIFFVILYDLWQRRCLEPTRPSENGSAMDDASDIAASSCEDPIGQPALVTTGPQD